MTMTMDELMKVLDMQEDILQFTHFTNADAWELGTMILMEARRRGAQVGIMIRRSNGEVVFQYCDNGITPHNVELMRRKSNSVLLTERSSLQLYMAATNAPESLSICFLYLRSPYNLQENAWSIETISCTSSSCGDSSSLFTTTMVVLNFVQNFSNQS